MGPGDLDAPCTTCRARPPAFEACACAVAYAYPWDGLIARFKFGGEPGWASTFAALMRARPGIRRLLGEAEARPPKPGEPSYPQYAQERDCILDRFVREACRGTRRRPAARCGRAAMSLRSSFRRRFPRRRWKHARRRCGRSCSSW